MNLKRIRIRMPKWQAIRSADWAKELLMTFIGATLSIILTFGTAHFLDRKQQRADGRQMAMMVIHDIENNAKTLSECEKAEEKFFNISQVVLNNVAHLDSIPLDSLMLFVQYITASAINPTLYDESSEKIFLSSQESWKNISNPTFIDAVQTFYHERRLIFGILSEDRFFAKPVSNEDYYSKMFDGTETLKDEIGFMRDYVRECCANKNVKIYVDYSYIRRRYYAQFAEEMTNTANRCKFMMGITDEELAQYVANRARTGKQLKERELVGRWKMLSTSNYDIERIYNSDHSIIYVMTYHMSYSHYTGQVDFQFSLQGTWELQGDSIITYVQPDYKYEIDRSRIQYHPEAQQSVDEIIAFWEQNLKQSIDAEKEKGDKRNAAFVSIDATKNKMEYRVMDKDEIGNDEEKTYYLVRQSPLTINH